MLDAGGLDWNRLDDPFKDTLYAYVFVIRVIVVFTKFFPSEEA